MQNKQYFFDQAIWWAHVDDVLEEIVVDNESVEYWEKQQGSTFYRGEWEIDDDCEIDMPTAETPDEWTFE